MAELVVYGRDSCSVCSRFRGSCEHHGFQYRYADIDNSSHKSEMLRKLRATEWFKGGKFGLPLVDVYGQLLQRPAFSVVQAAWKALPKEDAVEKLKRQFKDLDCNRDGTLSFDEMKDLLSSIAPGLSEGQQQQLFCAADVNQNGVLELDEFIDFVMYGKVSVAKIEADLEPELETKDVSGEGPTAGEARASAEGAAWRQKVLEAHNMARRDHGVLPLYWSEECYRLAQQQAARCQAASQMLHGHVDGAKGRQGQNLYWDPCICPHPNVMVSCWLREAQQPGYDFGAAKATPGTEQFTQVVWKGTTHVAMALSEDEKFCVANYFPAGNVGDYKDHVFPVGTAVPSCTGALASAEALVSVSGRAGAEATFTKSADGVETLKVRRHPHPAIDELLEPCPGSDFQERIGQAFQQGADLVTIDRVKRPGVIHVRVIATSSGGDIVAQFRRGFNLGGG